MGKQRQTRGGYVVVGVSAHGFRYWIFSSDVDAAAFKRYMEGTRTSINAHEDYTIRRANETQYEE